MDGVGVHSGFVSEQAAAAATERTNEADCVGVGDSFRKARPGQHVLHFGEHPIAHDELEGVSSEPALNYAMGRTALERR